MSESAPRNPRLENFEANKARYEAEQAKKQQEAFESALYDTAGETDFSEEARRRIEEADAYERHLHGMARDDYAHTAWEGGKESRLDKKGADLNDIPSPGYLAEVEDAYAENERYDAEIRAREAKLENVPTLRRMAGLADRIAELKDAHKIERATELEDKLEELLVGYRETDDYDAHVADMIIERTAPALVSAEATPSKAKKVPEVAAPAKNPEVSIPAPETETGEESAKARILRLLGELASARTPEPTSAPSQAPRQEKERTHETEALRLTIGSRESRASYHEIFNQPSEDYLLADEQNRIFAVFDGMGGGGGNPDTASRVAAQAAHERLVKLGNEATNEEAAKALYEAFGAAREAVTNDGEGGSTVGTIVKFLKVDGRQVMAVAHAGDTRLLCYRKNSGIIRELTTDQSLGNRVFNGMSPRKAGNSSDEYKIFKVEPDMRFMICSDGITGDWDEQKLSDAEMKDAFTQSTPDASAQRFMEVSKKDDDKSILVIDVDGSK